MARRSNTTVLTKVKYQSLQPNAIPVVAGKASSRVGKTVVYGSISAFAANVLGNINKRHTVARRLRSNGGTVDGYIVRPAR